MLYAIVALLVIILDQAIKTWIPELVKNGPVDLIPGVIQLVNAQNKGGAFGILSEKNAKWFFIIVCAVFAIFVIVALATRMIKAPVGRWSLLFIMAGGISNCIDRLIGSGEVTDMIYLPFLEKISFLKDRVPIFNVADIFITVFCLVFILFVLFGGSADERYDDDDEDEDEDEYEDEDEEEEDEEDEDEEEERRPRGLGALFGRSRGEDEDEDEDDEDEEEEDEDEDEQPRGFFARLRSRSRDEDEDEDEEEEDEEEEEEEDDDDLPPSRRPSRYDRAARNGRSPSKHAAARKPSRVRDEEEEDEDEEEADEAPVLRRPRAEKREPAARPKRSTRRDRQAELDEKYARFKAERAAREQQWSAPEEDAPVIDPSDPFAEWDAAAHRAEKPAPAPAPEAEIPAPAPAPKPAPAPAPKSEPKDESMEFSLEDILAEFK